MEKLAALLIVGMLVGCLAPAGEVEPAEETDPTPLFERLGAEPQAADETRAVQATLAAAEPTPPANGSWYVASVMGSPATGLSSFEWTVPANAAVPWGYNERFDADETVIALEIALLTEDGALPTTWGFLTFEETDGLVMPGDGYGFIPMTASLYGTSLPIGGSAAMARAPPEPEATAFVTLDGREAGETIRFVLFAQTASEGEVGLAFRVLDHDPYHEDSEEEPVETPELFLAAREGTRPTALPARATGSGFAAHVYSDLLAGSYPAGSTFGVELVAGEPSYSWNLPPDARALGGVHTLAASATGTLDRGFDLVSADYYSAAMGAARYTAAVNIQGTADSVSGVSPDAWPTILTGVWLHPAASVIGTGDGDGASDATLEVERVFAPGLVAVASVAILEFGATLEELIGLPAPPHTEKFSSDALPVRDAWEGGHPIRLPGGGSFILELPRDVALL